MSSSLYIGPPGVGKTLALVRYVILPALERQQRVVTNIPLNDAAFVQRLGCNLDGLIVQVTADQIRAPNFWFTAESAGEPITKGGDCIVIDECHEFYGTDQRIRSDAEVFRAVRLQRKFTGGTGNFSTNIVFATQLYEDMTRSLRNVCDSMYFMQKLTVVGRPDSYRVDIFADCRKPPTRGTPVNSLFGTYESEYFALYNSYSTGVGGFSSDAPGLETVTDDRLNIWNTKMGWGPFKLTMRQAKYLAVSVAVLSFAGLIFLFQSILSRPVVPVKSPPAVTVPSVAAVAPGSSPAAASDPSAGTPPTPAPAPAPAKPPPPRDPIRENENPDYRLVGLYRFDSMPIAVVADRAGIYRYLVGSFETVNAGPASHILVDGKVIAPWTGIKPSSQTSLPKMETSR